MNRKKISKGLKILSIAGAVVVCSTTIITAERASSAGFWSRLTGGLRRIFTSRGTSSGSANLTAHTTGRGSVLPRTPSSGSENLRVKFRGIESGSGKSAGVRGILNLRTGNSTTNGNVGGGVGDDIRTVVKMDRGGRPRSRINTTGDTGQVRFPVGTVEDGLHYASLGARPKIKTQSGGTTTTATTGGDTVYAALGARPKIKTQSGSTTTTAATGSDTIYSAVKGQATSGATSFQTPSSSQASTSQQTTSTSNVGGGGRRPVPAPRTNPNVRPIKPIRTTSTGASENVISTTQATTSKTGSGSDNRPPIPARPKMTLNERLGLGPDGKRVMKTENQSTTTTTSPSPDSKPKKRWIPKLELKFGFGGKKQTDQVKQTSFTNRSDVTSSTSNAPTPPERPKNLPRVHELQNDWKPLQEQSKRHYGQDVKLDKWGLPEINGVERDFVPTTRPGYGGTVMVLRPKDKK